MTTQSTPASAPSILDEISAAAPAGTVLPPRNIRDIIEKTAGYVARNGQAFEAKILASQSGNAKMSFLSPEDAYNAYYLWRRDEVKAGRGTHIAAGRKEGEVSFSGREERKPMEPPKEFEFSARMPNISAQDLEVVKLTALYVARLGRGWMTALSQREAGNFQFDFLRPQHSLYQFFSRLVDQYSDLLATATFTKSDHGANTGATKFANRISGLENDSASRQQILTRAKKRAEWVRHQQAQRQAAEENEEKERITYAQIDWHDFVVVETVLFDEADESAELPPPTRLNDLQSASLEQKAAMRVGVGRRIEEAMPGAEDFEVFYGAGQGQGLQQDVPVRAPSVQLPQQQPYQPPPQQSQSYSPAPAAQQQQPTRPSQPLSQTTPGNPIIRPTPSNHQPLASQLKPKPVPTSLCPNCHAQIPNDQIAEHMRIEMLDPQWREQKRKDEVRSSTTNLRAEDVGRNLKRMAGMRGDVFDSAGRVAAGEVGGEEKRRRVEAEGGEAAGGGAGGVGGGNGVPGVGSMDVKEQIRLIHERARNG